MSCSSRLSHLGVPLMMLFMLGCDFDFGEGWDPSPPPEAEEDDFDPPAPTIALLQPDWPPVGPNQRLGVEMTSPAGLAWMEVSFAQATDRTLSGTSALLWFEAEELGDGYGSLQIRVRDDDGGNLTRRYDQFLVDLSPPIIELGTSQLALSNPRYEAWIADMWVLGGAELTVGKETYAIEFEEGYPQTLGTHWDASLVFFDVPELSHGEHPAELTVRDAAGNVASESFVLDVDGVAPTGAIASPAPGAVVSGPFDITVSAFDEDGGQAWVELSLSGSPLGSFAGPQIQLTLHSDDFGPGAHELRATVRDAAGNSASLEPVVVHVQ